MFVALLVGVLAAVAADRKESPFVSACVIGADQDDVIMMLGQPDAQAGFVHGPAAFTVCRWARTDWLGGRCIRLVGFADNVAEDDETTYEPFAEAPPWLDALRDAFGPHRPAPGAKRRPPA